MFLCLGKNEKRADMRFTPMDGNQTSACRGMDDILVFLDDASVPCD